MRCTGLRVRDRTRLCDIVLGSIVPYPTQTTALFKQINVSKASFSPQVSRLWQQQLGQCKTIFGLGVYNIYLAAATAAGPPPTMQIRFIDCESDPRSRILDRESWKDVDRPEGWIEAHANAKKMPSYIIINA